MRAGVSQSGAAWGPGAVAAAHVFSALQEQPDLGLPYTLGSSHHHRHHHYWSGLSAQLRNPYILNHQEPVSHLVCYNATKYVHKFTLTQLFWWVHISLPTLPHDY